METRGIGTVVVRFARVPGLLAVLAGNAFALDPNHAITQYGHTAWTAQDGRLPGAVFALTQTRDGWLWVGTAFGLFRFDGIKFSRLSAPDDEPARSEVLRALAPDSTGGLWIGTRYSISYWAGSAIQRRQAVDRAMGAVSVIHVDRRGNIWVGTAGFDTGGLARIGPDGLRPCTSAEGFTGGRVQSIAEDQKGNVWIGSVNGLFRWDGQGFRKYGSNASLGTITALTKAPNGEIIGSTDIGALKRVDGGTIRDYPGLAVKPRLVNRVLLTDRDGGLWIGTNTEGLIHIHQGKIDQFTRSDGLSSDTVFSLLEDREGNIWAGTQRGLDRFRDLPATSLSKREGLSDDAAGSVFAARPAGVWVGTMSGLNRIDGQGITRFGKGAGLPSEHIGSIYEDRTGRLWVNSPNGLVVGSNGLFHPLPGGGVLQSITAAVEDRDGVLWFADRGRGLVKVEGSKIVTVTPWSAFGNKQAWALAADPAHGGLLIGFAQGGAAYYLEGHPTRWYTAGDGLGGGTVTDIQLDADGTVWLATLGGLSRLRDGRITTLTTTHGLACDPIYAMVEDGEAALWLNSPCGLQFVSRQELTRWAASPNTPIHSRVYAAADGMRQISTASGHFRRATKSADGRLWFAVLDGVTVVDPKRLHRNPLPPTVVIEALRVDDKPYSLGADLRVDPVRKELQIDYTALSLVDPGRVRFRYILEGHERKWHDASERREAFYSDLSPGRYRFRVTACNNESVWNETGASLDFWVAPTLYQTAWFRLLCAAAGASVLWALHLARLRYMQVQMHVRFEERLRERTRIGRELHDTLLQNIAAFALQLGGISKVVVNEPQAAIEGLSDLRREAEHWIEEARESVCELRSGGYRQTDFCEAVRSAGERIMRAAGVRFSVATVGIRRTVPPAMQEELLKIVSEALRNTVRHARATEVGVEISFPVPGHLEVEVEDNGRGCDVEAASRKKGHWGLVGMKERAQKLGAEFDLISIPGQGTLIRIHVSDLPPEESSISNV